MKVLHISYMDGSGGAHIAARRVCEAQIKLGIQAEFLVANKVTDKPYVRQISFKRKLLSMFGNMYNQRVLRNQKKHTNPVLHSLNSIPARLDRVINSTDCDVVNLHWINGEFFNVADLGRINKPIVWTLHDMWPFSGAEHYDDLSHPDRFVSGYSPNNRPKHYTGTDFDKKVFNRKLKSYGKNISLVCPSKWMKDCSESSFLFEKNQHQVIGNTLDSDIFKPIEQRCARLIFNLPADKKLVLFGAFNSSGDPRKGGAKLEEAIVKLKAKPDEVEFVIFGGECRGVELLKGYTVHHIGCFSDEQSLATLYSAVDCFVAPSLQDNLPNTILEALACDTPTIAFDVGGISDMVVEGTTGYLVTPGDAVELARKIDVHLETESSFSCREYFLNNFDSEIIAKSYLDFYKSIVD